MAIREEGLEGGREYDTQGRGNPGFFFVFFFNRGRECIQYTSVWKGCLEWDPVGLLFGICFGGLGEIHGFANFTAG